MTLEPLVPVDTRTLFRPVSTALVMLLRELTPEDWDRPTVAGSWIVKDIVAHLVDSRFRRLSFERDRMALPAPDRPIGSDHDFVAFINSLNAQWVSAAKRLSPRVLTDLFERASSEVADWFERLPLDAPALFPVSWAGEQSSAGWFDVAREFTELWHHQEQIRMAVGAASLGDPRYLRAVLDTAVRGLPHAFRDTPAEAGETVAIEVVGPAGGRWTLVRALQEWTIAVGSPSAPTARVTLGEETAWKLLFNVLSQAEIAEAIRVDGRIALAGPLLRARSVIV